MSQEPINSGSLVYAMSELPAALGVGNGLARRLVQSGELPARKLGSRTVVLKEDVVAFLRNLPKQGTAA